MLRVDGPGWNIVRAMAIARPVQILLPELPVLFGPAAASYACWRF